MHAILNSYMLCHACLQTDYVDSKLNFSVFTILMYALLIQNILQENAGLEESDETT